MEHEQKYKCMYQEQIRTHDLKIAELESEIHFKKEKIDDLKHSIDEMNKKLDNLIVTSTRDDTNIELQITSLNAEVQALKEARELDKEETDKRINRTIAIASVVCAVIALVMKLI